MASVCVVASSRLPNEQLRYLLLHSSGISSFTVVLKLKINYSYNFTNNCPLYVWPKVGACMAIRHVGVKYSHSVVLHNRFLSFYRFLESINYSAVLLTTITKLISSLTRTATFAWCACNSSGA